MGLLGIVVKVVGLLILALIGISAYLYFTDYEAEATVKEKGQDSGGHYVIIRPKLIPMDYQQRLDSQSANFVCEGYEVTFRIQSQHYRVMDDRGRLVYDSDTGLNNPGGLVQCPGLLT